MKPLSSAHARVAVWCIVSFRWWTSVPLRVRYGLLFQCMLELVCNFLTVLRRHQTPTDGHAHTLYETNTKLTFYWVRYETRRGYGDFYTVCEALPKRPPHSESHLLSITHPSQRAYIISSESASGCALGAYGSLDWPREGNNGHGRAAAKCVRCALSGPTTGRSRSWSVPSQGLTHSYFVMSIPTDNESCYNDGETRVTRRHKQGSVYIL